MLVLRSIAKQGIGVNDERIDRQKSRHAEGDRHRPGAWAWHVNHRTERPCLDHKIYTKILYRMFGRMYGVLNKIYIQSFLHGWIVNCVMNLTSLFNP